MQFKLITENVNVSKVVHLTSSVTDPRQLTTGVHGSLQYICPGFTPQLLNSYNIAWKLRKVKKNINYHLNKTSAMLLLKVAKVRIS